MQVGVRGILAVGVASLLLSCGNQLQTREAVERGVRQGVTQRGLNLDAMDVSVSSVKFHGKQADAVVSFAPKGGKISEGVTMRYTLEEKGREWVIVGRSTPDMKQHTGGRGAAGMGAQPPSVPLPDPMQPLPQGHPAIGGTPQ